MDVGNNIAAAPFLKLRGNPLIALDRLPPTLRRALWESVVEWDPRELRRELNRLVKTGVPMSLAIQHLLESIRRADQIEIAEFSRRWPSRFGAYPHVAAGATLQPYERQPARRGP
jgi:Family of unknown function (DUF6525)